METKVVREAQLKISENANKILKALSNDKFQLELEDSGKEMKIFVRDFTTGEQRQVEYCSGGEKFLTAVSLAVAIGQSANGQNIANTLIIDEGFGALDDKNRVLMVNELSRLTDIFQNGRVVIVSHQDDVQENFANRCSDELAAPDGFYERSRRNSNSRRAKIVGKDCGNLKRSRQS